MSDRLVRALVCVLVSVLVRPVEGTDRYFSDREAASPSGRFVVEAKSPQNAGDKPPPFARDFLYVLRDVDNDRVLWSRVQPKEEGSPVGIHVSDDGWVVVRTGHNELVALEPTSGETAISVRILEELPEEERARFTYRTTAGWVWANWARLDFVDHEGRALFVVRTWWDRRLMLDLDEGRLVEDPERDVGKTGEGLIAACDDSDRSFVLATLDGAGSRWRQGMGERRWEMLKETRTAVHIAGRMRLHEAVASLRELELLDAVSGSVWGGREYVGRVDRNAYTENRLRQAVQLALWRMGEEEPRELGCVWFKDRETGDFTAGPGGEVSRAEGAVKVRCGMDAWGVLTAMGAPDFVVGRDAWDYEVGGDEPFTFRVTWDGARVGGVERIVPPVWKNGEERYVELSH